MKKGLENNKMQQTSRGQNGGSLLILVFGGPCRLPGGDRRAAAVTPVPPSHGCTINRVEQSG